MESIVAQILSGDLNVVSLLILFIIGILTKRFVPWWVHEDVVKKLDEYEEASPDLLEEVRKLMDIMNDPSRTEQVDITAPNVSKIVIEDGGKQEKPSVQRVRRTRPEGRRR